MTRRGRRAFDAKASHYWHIVRATHDPGRAMLGAWQKPKLISCDCSRATPTRQQSGSIRIVGQ